MRKLLNKDVVAALWSLWNNPTAHETLIKEDESGLQIKIGSLTEFINGLYAPELGNQKPQRVGRILRENLKLVISERRRDGFWVYWDEKKLLALAHIFDIWGVKGETDVRNEPEPKSWTSVREERERQDEKWGEQNHDPFTYLAILQEEVGELAQAALHTKFGGDQGGREHLREEAVHTAAVALAIVECLDRGKWTW